jgi:hypothetical protein
MVRRSGADPRLIEIVGMGGGKSADRRAETGAGRRAGIGREVGIRRHRLRVKTGAVALPGERFVLTGDIVVMRPRRPAIGGQVEGHRGAERTRDDLVGIDRIDRDARLGVLVSLAAVRSGNDIDDPDRHRLRSENKGLVVAHRPMIACRGCNWEEKTVTALILYASTRPGSARLTCRARRPPCASRCRCCWRRSSDP